MYDSRIKHHGFKKSEDGNWIYTKIYLTPSWFPIIKRKDETKKYKFDSKYFMEVTSGCGLAGSRWAVLLFPALLLGLYFNKLFLLLFIPGIWLMNKDLNKMHEKIARKLEKIGTKLN